MNALGRPDVDRLRAYADENYRLADAAVDDAERHGRLKQAAQALGSAARITDGLAEAIAPQEPAQGPVMNFGAPGYLRVFAPGPR